VLAEHKILLQLQGGTNEGRKPSLAALKGWFDKWFKTHDEFAPKFDEGKLNATGNPHDIDKFPLGMVNFFYLQQIKEEMKELAADKEKKKEKKTEDDKMAPPRTSYSCSEAVWRQHEDLGAPEQEGQGQEGKERQHKRR
jgi:hypothetical protein